MNEWIEGIWMDTWQPQTDGQIDGEWTDEWILVPPYHF